MIDSIKSKVRCPDCHAVDMMFNQSNCLCNACGSPFPIIEDKPVLIQHGNEVFPLEVYLKIGKDGANKPWLSKLVPSPSVNLAYVENLKAFERALQVFEHAYVLVLGAGSQRSWLDSFFSGSKNVLLLYCDIDTHALVDCFCDGHEIPFRDNTFQGVIATAVLEHVLYPERVVSEIYSVLVPGGILYSEIPFMQQVHEGAYDFTRYTLSGHRRLFNHFYELSSGLVAGPGTALVWALENFALCFARGSFSRSLMKAGVRLMFFWIKYFDYLFKDSAQAIDAASCTYFLGRKDMQYEISDERIIERYEGTQHLSHL